MPGSVCRSRSQAATIAGVVSGPGSANVRRAFVEAQNISTHTTVAVLSDDAGRYRIGALQAGASQVFVRAVGDGVGPVRRVTLADDTRGALDLVLSQGAVRWSDLSIHQGKELFPEGKGSDLLFEQCADCHAFQNEMATSLHDAEGWKTRVQFERTTMAMPWRT